MSARFVNVTTVAAAFAVAPDVDLGFEPDQLVLQATSGGFYFSFDGVVVHGHVVSAGGPLSLYTKRAKLWLKQDSGGAAAAEVSGYTIA